MTYELVRSVDGTSIAVEVSGSGPPLIVVGGALADRRSVQALRPLLEPHFTVCAYDRRGRGDSGDASHYVVELELRDLAAVVQLVGEPVAVYGHSGGGVLSLEAALQGVRLARILVYEPPYILDVERPRPPADLPELLDDLIAGEKRAAAVRIFLREGPGLADEAIADLEASPMWPRWLAMAPTLRYDARIAGQCLLPRERMATLDTPVRVVTGAASPGWIRSGNRALAGVLPNGRHTVLPDQTHAVEPEAIAKELLAFCA